MMMNHDYYFFTLGFSFSLVFDFLWVLLMIAQIWRFIKISLWGFFLHGFTWVGLHDEDMITDYYHDTVTILSERRCIFSM